MLVMLNARVTEIIHQLFIIRINQLGIKLDIQYPPIKFNNQWDTSINSRHIICRIMENQTTIR